MAVPSAFCGKRRQNNACPTPRNDRCWKPVCCTPTPRAVASSLTKIDLLYVAPELRQAYEVGGLLGIAHSHLQAVVAAGRKHSALYRRIDASRIYSNFGPLVREFESRFAHSCSIDDLR